VIWPVSQLGRLCEMAHFALRERTLRHA
jgi:hypothetical protein